MTRIKVNQVLHQEQHCFQQFSSRLHRTELDTGSPKEVVIPFPSFVLWFLRFYRFMSMFEFWVYRLYFVTPQTTSTAESYRSVELWLRGLMRSTTPRSGLRLSGRWWCHSFWPSCLLLVCPWTPPCGWPWRHIRPQLCPSLWLYPLLWSVSYCFMNYNFLICDLMSFD